MKTLVKIIAFLLFCLAIVLVLDGTTIWGASVGFWAIKLLQSAGIQIE